ncbi:hypothetical protein PMZ80_002992 [Knufia obscura]|uniref:Uncharacterized protein n=1 Tax=Knufia obscura TaxID=1635080 RepID=A0ABR0RZU3_9EURO|nr:hypothetical protein PMZ80_002992 [Knufia obscura]
MKDLLLGASNLKDTYTILPPQNNANRSIAVFNHYQRSTTEPNHTRSEILLVHLDIMNTHKDTHTTSEPTCLSGIGTGISANTNTNTNTSTSTPNTNPHNPNSTLPKTLPFPRPPKPARIRLTKQTYQDDLATMGFLIDEPLLHTRHSVALRYQDQKDNMAEQRRELAELPFGVDNWTPPPSAALTRPANDNEVVRSRGRGGEKNKKEEEGDVVPTRYVQTREESRRMRRGRSPERREREAVGRMLMVGIGGGGGEGRGNGNANTLGAAMPVAPRRRERFW